MADLRWGVLGATSYVATRAVLPAIRASSNGTLVAAASASSPDADGSSFGARNVYRQYEDVLADDDVDAVYIPLPNSMHTPWCTRAIEHGKHVLCEKPLATTSADAAALSREADRAGVVLMEAFMSPFHPRWRSTLDMVHRGEVGKPLSGRAVFTFPLGDPGNHRWDPAMGGGCLLDVGIYCVSPFVELTGCRPRVLAARAVGADSGVDAHFSAMLDFGPGGGFTAAIECSFDASERQLLEITGSGACLSVDRPFTSGKDDTDIVLAGRDGSTSIVSVEGDDPYRLMVEHFADVVAGRAPPRRPPAQSVMLLEILEDMTAAATQ